MGYYEFDDPVFPVSAQGMRASGMILEGASCKGCGKKGKGKVEEAVDSDGDDIPDDIYDDDDDGLYESGAVAEHFEASDRMDAMRAVLDWVGDEDHSAGSLLGYVAAYSGADIPEDEDAEIDPVAEERIDQLWACVPNALVHVGCRDRKAMTALMGGDDRAAEKVAGICSAALDANPMDDGDIVLECAFGFDAVIECAKGDEVRSEILEKARSRAKAKQKDVEEALDDDDDDEDDDLIDEAIAGYHRQKARFSHGKVVRNVLVRDKGASARTAGLTAAQQHEKRVAFRKLLRKGSFQKKAHKALAKGRRMGLYR